MLSALSSPLIATNSRANTPPTLALQRQLPLRVGLLGLGTVGSGTLVVLTRNQALIAARAGRPIHITQIAVRNTAKAARIVGQGMALGKHTARAQPRLAATQARAGQVVMLVNDPFAVVQHPDIDVVVEAIGGTTVAKALVLQAIAQGKHVVTANKALLAEHGDEIFAAAQTQGVIVAYEGAVAVSIPIVKALREGLSANRIDWLAGIVNGTSNYVLSAMRTNGISFDAALSQAQALGYAEADPALDVQGTDAAHKLAVLASNAFGVHVPFDAIHVEGITTVSALDMACAEQLGMVIKLLAIARQTPTALELRVHPTLLPANHMLAQVNGSMNAVMVKGDASGETLYYGAGAGAEQTGSAVIADLVDVARANALSAHQRVPYRGFEAHTLRSLPVLPVADVQSRYCLRIPVTPTAANGSEAAASGLMAALAAHGIAIESQGTLTLQGPPEASCFAVIKTQLAQESQIRQAVSAWQKLSSAHEPVRVLRMSLGLD